MPNLANLEYVQRVNRAIDYVMAHLEDPLPLEDVARVAAFSSFHFHRIFRMIAGETLAQFVKRARLERAVTVMSHRKDATLTDIALACGFSSSSDFSRCFRDHFGVSPSAFDVEHWRATRRDEMTAAVATATGRAWVPPTDNPDNFSVRIRDVPARRVAYLRVQRPYEGGPVGAAARLVAWARARGLAGGQWLGYQWDDPEIVALEKCRYDIGVEIPDDAGVGDDVSVTRFAAMKLAEIELAGPIDLELRALHWLYGNWLPTSGWAPDHQPCFEAWNGEPFAHGTDHFELRIQLAVVDATTPV